MRLSRKVCKLIEKYGTTITLCEGSEEKTAKAVIQPMMYKNKMYVGSDVIPLGFADKGHFLMIAPHDLPVKNYKNLVILDGDMGYTVKRSEIVKAGDEEVYIWAVLIVYAKEREDEYESA